MAETTTTIEAIKIDTAPSVKSLADLKKEIKDMKAQLLSLDKTSEEYSQLLTEIGNKQHALKEINEEVTKTNNDFGQSMSNMRGSLAGISGAIQTVTGVLSLMGVEAGKDSKLLKIMVSAMSITAGIQAIDAGVKSFKALSAAIKAATVSLKGMKAAMVSTGVGALVVALGLLVSKLMEASEETERLAEKTKEMVDNMVAKLNELKNEDFIPEEFEAEWERMWAKAEKVVTVRKGNIEREMSDMWGAASEKMAEIEANMTLDWDIEEEINKIKKQLNAFRATETKGTKEYAEGIKKFYNELKTYVLVQAVEMKNQGIEDFEDIKKEFNNLVIAERSAIAENDKAMKTAAKERQQRAKAAAKERAEQQKRQAENERTYLAKEIAMVKERYEEKGEGNYIPQLLALYDLQLQKEKEAIDAKVKAKEITAEQGEIDKRIAEQKHAADTQAVEDVQTLTRAKEADQQVTLLEADYQQKQYEAQKAYYTQELQWYSQLADSRTTELQAVQIESQQSEAEYQRTMSQMTDRIALLQQYLTLYAEQPDKMAEVQQEINDLQQEMTSVEQEQAKKRIDIAKKEAEAKKNINKKYLQAYQSVSGSVSSVLGSMSDSMEEGTQQWKNLKIAQAIIDTLAGSVTAFTSAMELGVPLGPIVGAAEMAAVLATGFATVAQIKNTQVNKDSAGGGSMPSITVNDQAVNALTTQASNVRLTNTDNDIIDLGEQLKQVKVVVSAREITDTQEDMKRVKVANTF